MLSGSRRRAARKALQASQVTVYRNAAARPGSSDGLDRGTCTWPPYLGRRASFAKVIHFDRRGTGGSDPTPPSDARPPWERYAEELTAVLDAAGVEQAAILAMFDVGPMAIGFSATNPQRTTALILANTSARHLAAHDYPIGIPPAVAEPLRAAMEEHWGTEELLRLLVPSRADDQRFCRWHAQLQRARRAKRRNSHIGTAVGSRRESCGRSNSRTGRWPGASASGP
jgi:pimeloyl-ACP methyl ester carboxylesterase